MSHPPSARISNVSEDMIERVDQGCNTSSA